MRGKCRAQVFKLVFMKTSAKSHVCMLKRFGIMCERHAGGPTSILLEIKSFCLSYNKK